MKNRYCFSLLTGLLLFTFSVAAQVKTNHAFMKLGAVTMDELQMKRYDADSSASAVILFESGRCRFDTSPGAGLTLFFEKHVIVKILKTSGYEWADVKVPLYRSTNSNREFITNIKGTTYNLVDGKIVADKLTKESIFEEKNTENWVTQKFTMPNVREGSVLEYSYRIQTPYLFTFREWTFQHTIPTLWSEYTATIPEYFHYKMVTQGYENFKISEQKPVNVNMGASNRNPVGTEYHWVMTDVPAIKKEPYMTSIYNYIAKIEFELGNVTIPGQVYQSYNNTWPKVCANLMSSEYFGIPIKKTGHLKDRVTALTGQISEPEKKMEAIYAFVKKEIKYNDREELYTDSNLRKILETRTGNAAEINLLLIAMLREAGLQANPVILSTRDNGYVSEINYPNVSKFNYVVGHVAIGEQQYLLDATEAMATANMLPVRCLNGQGLLIREDSFKWLDLEPKTKYTRMYQSNLVIGQDNSLKGKVINSSAGYAALDYRKAIQAEGEKKYIEKTRNNGGHWEVEKVTIENSDLLNEALKMEYEVHVAGQNQPASTIYLNPLQNQGEKENPFKMEERKFPIDFAMPQEEVYMFTYTIPDGYKVEEQPKNAILALPEKAGQFLYTVNAFGNTITVMSKVVINRPTFNATDYPYLKEFYNQIVAKHAEQIVLKKVN